MKAIIPAAGRGTRFLPATKAIPKEMLPVLDKPVIQYVVEEAAGAKDESGSPLVDEVVIVSNSTKRAIEDHFAPADELVATLRSQNKEDLADRVEDTSSGAHVSFVYQEEPAGLGDAVFRGMEQAGDQRCFVLLGDTIAEDSAILETMYRLSEAHGGTSVIAVIPVPEEDVSRFGVIDGREIENGIWEISELVEKPAREDAPSNLAIFGRYLLVPSIREILAKTEPGAGGEIQLTDALVTLLETQRIFAITIDPEAGFDTGTVSSWLDTNLRFSARQSS